MTVFVASVDLFYSYQRYVRKYITQREMISKIDRTGFCLRHPGMVVKIVTIISLAPVTIAKY